MYILNVNMSDVYGSKLDNNFNILILNYWDVTLLILTLPICGLFNSIYDFYDFYPLEIYPLYLYIRDTSYIPEYALQAALERRSPRAL